MSAVGYATDKKAVPDAQQEACWQETKVSCFRRRRVIDGSDQKTVANPN